MLYFATASTPPVRDAMRAGEIGMIANPGAGNVVEPGYIWCGDNGCFTGLYPGDGPFLDWLDARHPYVDNCRFIVAPDVPFDAHGTLARFDDMAPKIRAAGFPVALAAQNGQENLPVPWDQLDCLFLAGDTEWKIGSHARRLAAEARDRGKWVHMGRVNSLRRLRIAEAFGCHSADGTFLTYAPDTNLPRMRVWLADLRERPSVFSELYA